jgi:hypothetical protein
MVTSILQNLPARNVQARCGVKIRNGSYGHQVSIVTRQSADIIISEGASVEMCKVFHLVFPQRLVLLLSLMVTLGSRPFFFSLGVGLARGQDGNDEVSGFTSLSCNGDGVVFLGTHGDEVQHLQD